MPLQTPDPRLPKVLRESKLLWKPRTEYQAPAPAPDDSWFAHVGGLSFDLDTRAPAPISSPSDPPFTLTLRTPSVLEAQTWHPSSLAAAAQIADALIDLLLEQLRSSLQEVPRANAT
jgi:hypothetical protein